MHTITGTTEQDTFLELNEASFYNGSFLLFDKISWKIKNEEHWAIAGPVGSGKTSLIEAILGKHILKHGEVKYPFLEKYTQTYGASVHIRDVAAVIFFQENSYLFNYSDFYYQQRFNASDAEGVITAEQFLRRSVSNPLGEGQLEEITQLLHIEDLLPLEFIKLSNGQTRKLRIAKALLNNPALLILDNPFIGLDTYARQELHQLINKLILHGTKIIITTNQAEIPERITHVLLLQNFTIKGLMNKQEFLQVSRAGQAPKTNEKKTVALKEKPKPDFDIAVQFKNVEVQYDTKKVLQDINWTVRKGEKWALLGPNGSGKSTILSLINADHPQAYANHIILFDRKRGTGESIWDIKKRIGFISPELHLYFRKNSTCREVAATGFFDSLVLTKKLTEEQENLVAELFDFYSLSCLLQKSFLKISSGEQRIVLLIRSLIKNPDLIIWDEPFQGLDTTLIGQSILLLQQYCNNSNTLLFVTHYAHEIPPFVNHFLFLEDGKATITTGN